MVTEAQPSNRQLTPSELVRIEAAALDALADRLEGAMLQSFEAAITLLLECTERGHRVIVSGVGKSGLMGRKIAATLCSTGVPAHFLHPTEALHGDLGMVASGDVLLALSSSGSTEELVVLLPLVRRLGVPVLALCGSSTSALALHSDVFLDASISAEACPHDLAPTASTTVMLALGDALAVTLSSRRGFVPQHFADLHPGGRIGQRLTKVRDLMHAGDALPVVELSTPLPDVIYEMSRKKLGITTVLDVAGGRRLLGMISDGDLRRLLGEAGAQAISYTAGEIMNRHPVTIGSDTFASTALGLMEERKITCLIVVTSQAEVQGVVHIHDLWEAVGVEGSRA